MGTRLHRPEDDWGEDDEDDWADPDEDESQWDAETWAHYRGGSTGALMTADRVLNLRSVRCASNAA